ncbi:MAG: DUF1501 domain-containing protein [Planctomycetaceae bacterium]|nr:DUF1501 domain-containing protein [Planctomycetaceae bacterium]
MHCRRFQTLPLTRRDMLARAAGGFGAAAFAALLDDDAYGAKPAVRHRHPAVTHAAKAKSVIFLYMDGGPSQVDTFDPKPLLDKEHGNPIKMKTPPTQFNNVGKVLKSQWKFRRYGESGLSVSDLLPHTATCADDLCVVRSMTSDFSEHTFANYFLHSGSGLQGRPSMGAWTTYGLGSECRDLPGFIVLNGGLIPPGGLDNFGSGFLPANFQGSVFKSGRTPVADVDRREATPDLQRNKLRLLERLDRGRISERGTDDALESAVANYELAYRMQSVVPELMDLSRESVATKRLYGLEAEYEPTRIFGAMCLSARRLVEKGVRFIEVTCPSVGTDRWDQHSKLKEGHERNCRAVDQPTAGLLRDLKSRGLLDETLVIWGGEFGRTPMAQGSDGRDHNPFGFTMWLAGGGVQGGTTYGRTDDWGYFAVENKVEIHDLHATMLHLLGVDHQKLTYRFGGRDFRLTDVFGDVIQDIIA